MPIDRTAATVIVLVILAVLWTCWVSAKWFF